MLSKCANPGCSASFLYFNRGKLFRWDTKTGSSNRDRGASAEYQSGSARHLEFFWLCEDCAPFMTLVFEKGSGIVTRPVVRAKAAAATAGSVATSSR